MFDHILFKFLIVTVLLILFILLFSYITKHKNQIDDQNKKLIQSYLHIKFIHQSLIDSVNTPNSVIFCNFFITKIKEYFNLSDFFVIDSLNMLSGENNTYDRSIIIKFIKDHLENILEKLSTDSLIQMDMSIANSRFVLHISKFSEKEENDSFIVSVEDYPSLLTKDEKLILESSINLLKARVIYD